MLEKLKAWWKVIVIAGDGSQDSMGHSAKFGAYTTFFCIMPMIIHFALVQVGVLLKIEKSRELCRGKSMYEKMQIF